MIRRVLKWTVPVDDSWHEIGGGKVLLVAAQYDQIDSVQVWTEEQLDTDMKPPRRATIVGTGHLIPLHAEHLGSAVAAAGDLLWHVYGREQA